MRTPLRALDRLGLVVMSVMLASSLACSAIPPRPTHTHPHAPSQSGASAPRSGVVVLENEVPSFENNGNTLRGLATSSRGAEDFEVWRTSVAVGSATPLHTHETEEVFVFLRGKGRAVVGDRVLEFEAPCTVIAPANVSHQFINIGDEPTDAIVVVGVGSRIYDARGEVMQLPWRE